MKLKVAIILLFISSNISSCIPQGGSHFYLNFPVNIKKKKKKIAPPIDFVDAVFTYKNKFGYWPYSEDEFESFYENRNILNRMYNKGFLSWRIVAITDELLVIDFIHEPVHNQIIGRILIPGRDVNLRTTFHATGQIHENKVH